MGSKYKGGGSPQFQEGFSDIIASNRDSGITKPGRGGIFGSGVNGEEFLNSIIRGAALAQGDYGAASQMSRREPSAAERMAQELEVYRAKKGVDREFPPNNDTAADYEFWKERLSPEEFETWKRNKVDPPQYRQGPDGQFYRIQAQEQPKSLGSSLPQGWSIEGGPTPQASGGFPRTLPPRRYR